MPVAQNWRPAGARRAVRRDQRPRIDLEMPRGLGVDVRATHDGFDAPLVAEQKPARLERVRIRGVLQQSSDQFA